MCIGLCWWHHLSNPISAGLGQGRVLDQPPLHPSSITAGFGAGSQTQVVLSAVCVAASQKLSVFKEKSRKFCWLRVSAFLACCHHQVFSIAMTEWDQQPKSH